MTELQQQVINELENNYGWHNIVDDVSIGHDLLKDTVVATEKVIKKADSAKRFSLADIERIIKTVEDLDELKFVLDLK